ncbi:YfcE family phosphodiesterase [[Eubacterium] cellulosolvens]
MTLPNPLDRTPKEDLGYCFFGAETLNNHLNALESQIEGVRKNEDIECIHKMRVASRRIRAALPLFLDCFPKTSCKKWLKEIKRIGRTLGSARDTDVQIAFIKKYLDVLCDEKIRIGVEILLSKHNERRVNIQPEINNKLEELRYSHVIENIRDYCQQIKQQANAVTASLDAPSIYVKAHTYISEKLGDFLVMEDCVHHENDIVNHHKMRIRAKWLRYTIETFSPKYDEKLNEYVSTMKYFQDLLGEMHDYDVWIDFVPKFITQIKLDLASRIETNEKIPTIENGLLRFLQDIQEMRRSRYREFVSYWEDTKKKQTFEHLRQITSTEFMGAENGVKSLIEKENPKIAVLADVHANLQALTAVLEDARGKGIEVFLNAGDFVGYGAFPNEVIEILRSNKVLSVIGNYDLKVLEARRNSGEKDIALKFAQKKLTRSNKAYLNSLPKNIALEIKEKKLLMVHGSPESIEEHIYPNTSRKRLRELISRKDADIVIVGHSHRQFSRTIDEVTIINPGSVGRADDNNPKAAYSIIGFNPFSVELLRVSYDVEAAAHAIRKEGLPENLAQMLLCGLPLKKIIRKERVKKQKMTWRNKESLIIIKKVAQKYEDKSTHPEQVKKVALKLFDALKPLHKLGALERYWLECAAMLHDIGWSRGGTGHNKTSLKLILNDCDLPFNTVERYVIGSIARYHRKKLPNKKHYNYASLSPTERQKVVVLSSILRVADALDYSHGSIVKNLRVSINPTSITIKCKVNQNPVLEEQSLNKKKDLFEKTFSKDLIIIWIQSS